MVLELGGGGTGRMHDGGEPHENRFYMIINSRVSQDQMNLHSLGLPSVTANNVLYKEGGTPKMGCGATLKRWFIRIF